MNLLTTLSGVFHRLSSNPSYTPPDIDPSAPSTKPRVTGVGKAPKPKRKLSHSKPYDRPTNPARPTSAALRHFSTNKRFPSAVWTSTAGVTGSQIVIEDPLGEEDEIVTDHISDSAASDSEEDGEEGEDEDDEGDAADITLTSEPAIPALTATTALTAPTSGPEITITPAPALASSVTAGDLFVRIPSHVYPPDIPSMSHVLLEGERVPVDFVRYHLDTHLPRVLAVGSMFRPISYASSVPDIQCTASGLLHSFAFGVPKIVHGHDTNGQLAEFVSGYEPDLLLALKMPAGSQGRFVLKPIKHIAYAARCRLFPSLPSRPPTMPFVHPSHTAELEPEDAEDLTDSDAEDENEDEDEDRDDDTDNYPPAPPLTPIHTGASTSSVVSRASSTGAASEAAAWDTGAYVHLPVLAIDVPSLDTFDLVHNQLYRSGSGVRFEPALLELAPEDALNVAAAYAALERVTMREISRRLTRVHGVWANMCALGVDDEKMWAQLDRAYRMLLAIIRRRATMLPRSSRV